MVESQDEGKAFACQPCIKAEKSRQSATKRSPVSASNLYAHLKSVHPGIYGVVLPIVKARERNKKQRIQNVTFRDVMNKYRQRIFDDALLKMLVAPDFSKTTVENEDFNKQIRAANPNLKVPTRETITSRLWDKLYLTIGLIKEFVSSAEFIVPHFRWLDNVS